MNFKSFLNGIKNKFKGKASLEELIKSTPLGYKQRSRFVGNISFKGYRYGYSETEGVISGIINSVLKVLGLKKMFIANITLKFLVEGAVQRNNKRNKYTVILQFPLNSKIETQNLITQPVKVFCSCDSFKYFMAYALNNTDQVYKTIEIEKFLGVALTEEPKVKNPEEIQFLCKHTLAVVDWLKTKRIDSIIKSKSQLSKTEIDKILN